MNTAPHASRRPGILGLLLLLLASPALAQEPEAPREDDKTTIIIEIDDGHRRVIVDGEELSGDEAEAYFREWSEREEGPHVFTVRPRRDRAFFFRHNPGEEAEVRIRDMMREPMVFDVQDPFSGDSGIWVDRLAEGLHGELGMQMQEHAEIARMDAESRRMAQEARRAEGAERERLEEALRNKLDEIFERKQALRAERLERLRDELQEVEAEHAERQRLRQEILERRLKDLLGERERYDW